MNIKRLMKKHNIRASKLAEVLDVSIHSIYGYTKKTGHLLKPDLDVLLLLALYFNVDIESLLESN
jgi:transcriptional regulator with XRE-family HTH domain